MAKSLITLTEQIKEEILEEVLIKIEEMFQHLVSGLDDADLDLSKLQSKLKGNKGDKGDKGDRGDIGPQGVQGLQGISGKDGINGKDADETKIVFDVLKQIPKPDQAKMIAEVLRRIPQQEKLSFDKIARGLETLQGEQRLDYYALKNRPLMTQGGGGGSGGGGDTVRYTDLTSQCDGQTKTFTLTRVNRVVGVFGTQFPIIARPEVDWTFDTSTGILTLTSEVSAPASGQTLWVLYIEG